jgi:NAD(P)H-nitrite reductase large subunit
MKMIKVKNDVLFDRVVTINDENLENKIINFFGSLKNYYAQFLKKNYELEEEEAFQIVDYFFKDYKSEFFSLKHFFKVVKSLEIEVLQEEYLCREKLLDRKFVVEWFYDKYIEN